MPSHKSAIKRHRQSVKRTARNRSARAGIRTTVKEALTLASQGKKEEAVKATREATKLLDKAVRHGVLHKNNASRRISRLSSRVAKLTAAK